jgi:hypothetical protein
MFLSGADEAVVVKIVPETGKERRASHEEFLLCITT